ncbi:MAG: hypothetical protein ACRCZS_10660 [Chroococcidiopsis sp.]
MGSEERGARGERKDKGDKGVGEAGEAGEAGEQNNSKFKIPYTRHTSHTLLHAPCTTYHFLSLAPHSSLLAPR